MTTDKPIRTILKFTSESYADPGIQEYGLNEAWAQAAKLGASKETHTVKTRTIRRDGINESIYPDLFDIPTVDVVVSYTFRRGSLTNDQ